MTIRVLLADDQALLRAGLQALIDAAADMQVIAEAASGREAVARARQHRPDVVVMDIRMPDLDGLAATRQITADPELAGVRVLVLTTFEIDEYVFQALRAGASGFIGKGTNPRQLVEAIRTIALGDALLSPLAVKALIGRFLTAPGHPGDAPPQPAQLDVLTGREREILAHVAAGLTNDDIAGRLSLSPQTVKTHINRTMAKLSAHDRAQLVVIAYETGLVVAGRGSTAPPR